MIGDVIFTLTGRPVVRIKIVSNWYGDVDGRSDTVSLRDAVTGDLVPLKVGAAVTVPEALAKIFERAGVGIRVKLAEKSAPVP